MDSWKAVKIPRAFILGFVFGTGAYLGYLVSDREVPFVQQYAEIIPGNPLPGSEVIVTWHGQRYRDCPGTVSRKIVDACKEVHTLESVEALHHPNDPMTTLARAVRLPEHIASGPATYYAETAFVCNWLQHWWPIKSVGVPVHLNIGPSEEVHCDGLHSGVP